jgi:hypothetical protein
MDRAVSNISLHDSIILAIICPRPGDLHFLKFAVKISTSRLTDEVLVTLLHLSTPNLKILIQYQRRVNFLPI